jgi:glycine/D-amino acid oxidase-like deaminating enzyme
MKKYDFLILGAGIFGITTAIELRKKKYAVAIINPDKIPHPLAESTDISKIIRMEYGSDEEYMDMAIECIRIWKEWNELFHDQLYHETGFLLLSQSPFDDQSKSFEAASYYNLLKRGYKPQRIKSGDLAKHFPIFNHRVYKDGFYHSVGGYAESGRVVETLTKYAMQLGVDVYEGQIAEEIIVVNNNAEGVKTREGKRFNAGNIIVCAGNLTPFLVPDLKPYMRITGHPVFHLQPEQTDLFTYPQFTVFAADISQTGWYGFPLHPKEKVIKVANHGIGLEIKNPELDERVVYEKDIEDLRRFLKDSIPALANSPIVYTRRCCYTDTLDGHFWIDRHPEIEGLTIGSGGSGHGFKMGPVLGEMIAAVAEGETHKWSARYRWRHIDSNIKIQEEARFKIKA